MVVGAEHVQRGLEAALELVQEVGDVGGEIGRAAVLADHDAVLFVAEIGGAEPGGAALLVQVAVLAQPVDRVLHGAGFLEIALGEPGVEVHAELGQVVLDVVEDVLAGRVEEDAVAVLAQQLAGAGDQGVEVDFAVAAFRDRRRQAVVDLGAREAPLVAVLGAHQPRDVVDVVAAVAVVRKADVFAAQFQVTQPDADREDVHLAAVVVDVVLALHRVAGGRQDAGETRAVGGAAPVADVQRPGRVGRNVLDRDPVAARPAQLAVLLAVAQHVANHPGQRAALQEDVDEARPGDFHPLDLARFRHPLDDRLGQLARRHAGRLGQHHRDVGGEVAVLRRARALELDREIRVVRQDPVALQVHQGLREEFFEVFFHCGGSLDCAAACGPGKEGIVNARNGQQKRGAPVDNLVYRFSVGGVTGPSLTSA